MNSTIKLFLVLITLTVILFSWITGQLGNPAIQVLIGVLIGLSVAGFVILNILEHRVERRKRAERESRTRPGPEQEYEPLKRSDTSYVLRERKAGLTWGGGNIKASEATRGTKRKFLGK